MESENAFSLFLTWMGPYKWPLILMALIVFTLIIIKTVELMLGKYPINRKKRGLNSILFWGFFSFGLGLFGQFSSIWLALQEIMKAPDLSPALVLTGLLGTFNSTLFGLGILLVSALAWWLFRSIIRMDEEEIAVIV